MKSANQIAGLFVVLGCFSASAQTIFDENFDGGYTGAFYTSSYTGSGSPTATSATVQTSGGDPNGCFQVQMTTTTANDEFVGQPELAQVSGNTDSNPSDYVLSFDAEGSAAGQFQFIVQTWQNQYYGGSMVMMASTTLQLTAANTWQLFSVNLGSITSASATGGTWQLNYGILGSTWGGIGTTDTLKIDNIILTHLANSLEISSSSNPSADGAPVSFTATVLSNGLTATGASGQVVFSDVLGTISTSTVTAGVATSAAVSNLPVGLDTITAVYSGNAPSATNTFSQEVNPPSVGIAQSGLPIYTDHIVNGFQNYSWAAVNLQNTSPAYPGSTYDISVTDGGWQALAFQCQEINSTPYSSVTFWVNGGSSGGQHIQVFGLLDWTNQGGYPITAGLPANSWRQITVPLSSLNVANQPNFGGIWIQGDTGSAQPTFYVAAVSLVAAAAPSVVHLNVNAANVLQTVDARQFGVNTATWDGILGNSGTLPALEEIGCTALRWPGGSTSDTYHWASDASGNSTFRNLATNLGAQVFTTVNYGTGTAAEAAAWVLNANKTNNCNFLNWEVGNECYGGWETDSHPIPQDPYTYATNAAQYIQEMKAAYPSVPIKVGVVVVPGEDSYANNENHAATNPVTGQAHYGWTPVVLSQMNALGVLPDFLIYHFYWQYTPDDYGYYSNSPDCDQTLLQVSGNPSPLNWSDWASAASNLRMQITDYLGAAAGSNIQLCVTENNSDAGTMGRQSTSIVNALYLADSTCELMKTEFRSHLFWDLHNGDDDGDFDATIFGWRSNGDYGILDPNNNPYPTFYAEKLLQYFARAGDSVVSGTSDNLLLSAYATSRTNGLLTVLVINKDMTSSLEGQIDLANYVPGSTATVLSYGLAQDQATETNGAAASQDLSTNTFSSASTNFSYEFPPLTMTLFTLTPGPATLSALGVSNGNAQILLRGQAGAPYVIQGSADLITWSNVTTVWLTGTTSTNLSIAIAPTAPQQFYHAVWVP